MANDIQMKMDYEALPISAKDKERVQEHTQAIKMRVRRIGEHLIEIGNSLIAVKGMLGHGYFLNWLEVEFGWTDRTARNFMGVAEGFKSEIISDLEILPTALYMLSAPSTPEEAREFAVEYAQTGEKITPKVAREIIEAHQPSAPVVGPLPSQASMLKEIQKRLSRVGVAIHEVQTEAQLAAVDKEVGEILQKIDGLMDKEDRDALWKSAFELQEMIEGKADEWVLDEGVLIPGIREGIHSDLDSLGYVIENAVSWDRLKLFRESFERVKERISEAGFKDDSSLNRKVALIEEAIGRAKERMGEETNAPIEGGASEREGEGVDDSADVSTPVEKEDLITRLLHIECLVKDMAIASVNYLSLRELQERLYTIRCEMVDAQLINRWSNRMRDLERKIYKKMEAIRQLEEPKQANQVPDDDRTQGIWLTITGLAHHCHLRETDRYGNKRNERGDLTEVEKRDFVTLLGELHPFVFLRRKIFNRDMTSWLAKEGVKIEEVASMMNNIDVILKKQLHYLPEVLAEGLDPDEQFDDTEGNEDFPEPVQTELPF